MNQAPLLPLPALAFAVLLSTPVPSLAERDHESWQWRATAYAWLPTLSGSTLLDLGGGTEVSTDKILDALDFAFMGHLEVRKGRWGGFTDYIHLDFREDQSAYPLPNVRLDADMHLQGESWTLAGTYTLLDDPGLEMVGLAGVRYLSIDLQADWQASGSLGLIDSNGAVSTGPDYWDAIIGVRGRAGVAQSKWFVPYYLDVGTGDSELTWQAVAGLGYGFDWGEVALLYRHLSHDFEPDAFIRDLEFSGPAIGVSFVF
jgi:hypothetical protein